MTGTDPGGSSCGTPASTPDADIASQLSLLPGAALTALSTPAAAALSRLAASPMTARAWAALLARIAASVRAGGPVLWADARELYTLWLQGQVAAGALDEASAAKYLALVTQFIDHCLTRRVAVTSIQVAERLGTKFVQAWVEDYGSDRRTQNIVECGPAAQRLRRSAGRSLWYVLRLFGVTTCDLFLDVQVPPLAAGLKVRPLDDAEALALRTWAVEHPYESAQNAAVAGALLGARQGTLSRLLVCDIDLLQGLVWMPGDGRNRSRVQVLDSFALSMFTRRIEDIYALNATADGVDVLNLHLLSGRGQPTTAENVGMLLRSAIEYGAIRSTRVTPASLALWGSLRAYHHGPAATVLTSSPNPLGIRDIDVAAYVRRVTTRTASHSLGLSTADKGDDPYGLASN